MPSTRRWQQPLLFYLIAQRKDERHPAHWNRNCGVCAEFAFSFPELCKDHESAAPLWTDLGSVGNPEPSLAISRRAARLGSEFLISRSRSVRLSGHARHSDGAEHVQHFFRLISALKGDKGLFVLNQFGE